MHSPANLKPYFLSLQTSIFTARSETAEWESLDLIGDVNHTSDLARRRAVAVLIYAMAQPMSDSSSERVLEQATAAVNPVKRISAAKEYCVKADFTTQLEIENGLVLILLTNSQVETNKLVCS